MEYLKYEDFRELGEKYPQAFRFLLKRDLQREYQALNQELDTCTDPRRQKWIISRLQDLRTAPAIAEFEA